MAKMKRRQFLGTVGTAGAATFLAPRFSIGKSGSANEKPNIAMIGVGGIAGMAFGGLRGGGDHNIVAVCDVDHVTNEDIKNKDGQYGNRRPHAIGGRYNNHKNKFVDFRKMYDKMGKDIDGVCVNCPDHNHFAATIIAMQLGIHVCTQKPLTHDVWQSRTLLKAAKKYPKVITNMANQGHSRAGIRQMREIYDAGILGQVNEVHCGIGGPGWRSQYFHKPSSMPMAKEQAPKNFDWDQWIGPAAKTDYNKQMHPLRWRSFWNYGTGMLGDWFCHIGDGPVWILDLYDPTTIELTNVKENAKGVIPDYGTVVWKFPKRGDKDPCTLQWQDGWGNGGPKLKGIKGKGGRNGSFWYAEKCEAFLNERSDRPEIPSKGRRYIHDETKKGNIPEKYPRVPGGGSDRPHGEWLMAIKGNLPKQNNKPGSSFEYSARMTETCLLGVLAERAGGKIEWDAKNCKVTNRPELNALIKEPVRNGWEDYGKDLW